MPIVEYEIYNPFTLQKLDLSICKNNKINISFLVSINENELFLHDPSSNYYNDKCFPYTSKNRTDIILKDRREYYVNNNLTLCENNCIFIDYDYFTKHVNCECKVKNEINIIFINYY